ncbi:MAG TPA: hypothetical protein VGX92_22275 [Pyrinomonadaceae bacterium]|nr:hypothetical protein [Pyrinomonadaceae bacterium]
MADLASALNRRANAPRRAALEGGTDDGFKRVQNPRLRSPAPDTLIPGTLGRPGVRKRAAGWQKGA